MFSIFLSICHFFSPLRTYLLFSELSALHYKSCLHSLSLLPSLPSCWHIQWCLSRLKYLDEVEQCDYGTVVSPSQFLITRDISFFQTFLCHFWVHYFGVMHPIYFETLQLAPETWIRTHASNECNSLDAFDKVVLFSPISNITLVWGMLHTKRFFFSPLSCGCSRAYALGLFITGSWTLTCIYFVFLPLANSIAIEMQFLLPDIFLFAELRVRFMLW